MISNTEVQERKPKKKILQINWFPAKVIIEHKAEIKSVYTQRAEIHSEIIRA